MTRILIVAEAGINHNGDLHLAKALIREARWAGCDIWKTQCYSVDALFPDKQIVAQGKNWYEEVKRTELTKEQTFELADYCTGCKIEFMASAFDLERLGWLEEVGVKRHKIATRMNKSYGYIQDVINTNKEVIISCGLDWPVPGPPIFLPLYRTKFLYCVPEYPTPLNHLSLPPFKRLEGDIEGWDGFSDHTIGIEASMIAMARGATIIEKHFSLDPSSKAGPDHICSASPQEMKQLVEFARKVEEVL